MREGERDPGGGALMKPGGRKANSGRGFSINRDCLGLEKFEKIEGHTGAKRAKHVPGERNTLTRQSGQGGGTI